jgi:hypothetical protein
MVHHSYVKHFVIGEYLNREWTHLFTGIDIRKL